MNPQEYHKEPSLQQLLNDVPLFRAFGEETRVKIFIIIAESATPLTVSEVSNRSCQSQPNASRHLRMLHDAGWLNRERHRNEVFYSLNEDILIRLEGVCTALRNVMEKE